MTESYFLGIEGIMERLPHRPPFLLIDRVLSCEAGRSVVAEKCLNINEPYFAGHFPGHPVMPGVLILESMAQAACVLLWETTPPGERNFITYLAAVDKTRFRRPAVPGDRMTITAGLLLQRRTLWRFETQAQVDGELIAAAEITVAPGKRL